MGFNIKNDTTRAWQDDEYTENDLDLFAAQQQDWVFELREPSICDPIVVLDILCVPPISLQDRLKQDLYRYTNGPFATRSLLDLPGFFLSTAPHDDEWQLNGWYFYNQTSEANYTKNGRNISDYLNLDNADLLGNIEEFELPIDVPHVIELIQVMRIQERRTGLMFGAYKSWGPWGMEAKAPVYYLERNFFFTPAEERVIKKALLFDDDDSGSTSQKELERHVVSDQVGLGDTRFSFGYRTIENDDFVLDVGGDVTLPTAFAFSKGLIGSNFPRNDRVPLLNLLQIFCIGTAGPAGVAEVLEIFKNFGEAAFDKLSANLLQTSLGNDGHFGLAPFFYNQMSVGSRFYLTTRGAIEYLLPKREKRFYILKKDQALFTCDVPDNQKANKLAFLNLALIDTLVPRVFVTTIYPGFIVKLSSCLSGFFGKNWEFGLGGDIWWQSEEKFGKISANPLILPLLQKEKARRPSAYQVKVMGRVIYELPPRSFEWRLMLHTDYTVASAGIGQDFNIAIKMTFDV